MIWCALDEATKNPPPKKCRKCCSASTRRALPAKVTCEFCYHSNSLTRCSDDDRFGLRSRPAGESTATAPAARPQLDRLLCRYQRRRRLNALAVASLHRDVRRRAVLPGRWRRCRVRSAAFAQRRLRRRPDRLQPADGLFVFGGELDAQAARTSSNVTTAITPYLAPGGVISIATAQRIDYFGRARGGRVSPSIGSAAVTAGTGGVGGGWGGAAPAARGGGPPP